MTALNKNTYCALRRWKREHATVIMVSCYPTPRNNLCSDAHWTSFKPMWATRLSLLITDPEDGVYSLTGKGHRSLLHSILALLSPPQDHPLLTPSSSPALPGQKDTTVCKGRRWLLLGSSRPCVTFFCKYVNVLNRAGLLVLQAAGLHDVVA